MTVSQTNMAVDYSLTLPSCLVTKDSAITELVYVNLIIKIVSKSVFFLFGWGKGCCRGWALILGWAVNRINKVTYFWSKKKH